MDLKFTGMKGKISENSASL